VSRLVVRLIAWMVRRAPPAQRMMNSDHSLHLADRYRPFWEDEFTRNSKVYFRPPWWRPLNILLHQWHRGEGETWHDHPRWSITICLKGSLVEHSPWKSRVLTPGSVVFRSRKAIHRFDKPDDRETWTLFIVGRRNHEQNAYRITPFSKIDRAARQGAPNPIQTEV